MNIVVSAVIQSAFGLVVDNSANGLNTVLDCPFQSNSIPFYKSGANALEALYISKHSNWIINRARIDFIGAEGLRPGNPTFQFPATVGIQWLLPYDENRTETNIYCPYFGEWFIVNQAIKSNSEASNIVPHLVYVSGSYDSRNIPEIYAGHPFSAMVSLEITAVEEVQ